LSLNLQHALERLYGLERRKDKLGLSGTRELLAALGDPQLAFRSIHVAGTNGKGSTCAVIERVLRESGLRTGLFTSPHLVDFRERIRVDGGWADEQRLAERLDFITARAGSDERTFFEVCTALAFDDLAARGADWAVIEVGLGGRLDTTNVIAPELCVITPIGLDHTEILGATIELIAAEKAGILKPGIPVVLSRAMDERARAVIVRGAAACGANVLDPAVRVSARAAAIAPGVPRQALSVESDRWGRIEVQTPLLGRHQLGNIETALAALAALPLEISVGAVRSALERVRWPGRLEACTAEPRLWWDGAHNAPGLAALIETWQPPTFEAPPEQVVLALSRDKDAGAMLREIANAWPGTTLIATRSRNERALEASALADAATACGLSANVVADVAGACRAALAATRAPGRVLVTGSLFAVGEAMAALGGAPGEQM
jgi:dihydrofolate synthase / folylpolyglutamate synthase